MANPLVCILSCIFSDEIVLSYGHLKNVDRFPTHVVGGAGLRPERSDLRLGRPDLILFDLI